MRIGVLTLHDISRKMGMDEHVTGNKTNGGGLLVGRL